MSGVDVLIIGAGAAGLAAAGVLRAAGRSVAIADKGRVPGGRLATRILGGGRADYGAQFFTVRTPEFARAVAGWLDAGLVFEWSRGWSDGSLLAAPADSYPRYAAQAGFGALAAHLAEGLDVRLDTRLVALQQAKVGWAGVDAAGAVIEARAVLLTAPVPQSLALLAAGGVALPPADRAALAAVAYAPCLCGLFVVEGETQLPEPGALQRPGHAVSWISDNQGKGISPQRRIVTVHAGREASAARWAQEDRHVLDWLASELNPWLAPDAAVVGSSLKRWRYAVPTHLYHERCFVAALNPPLVFAGDAFDGPRVEGAFLSGWAAGQRLLVAL